MILGRHWVSIGLFFTCLCQFFCLTRNLNPGWNLVSVPVESPTTISAYLSQNLSGTLRKIWTFDDGWKHYKPGLASNELTGFQKNRGYWFLMGAGGGFLTLDSETSVSSLQIDRPEWALVSFNQTISLSLSEEVLSKDRIDSEHEVENIAKVWGFFEYKWKFFNPTTLEGNLGAIEPGVAYWFLIQDSASRAVRSSSPLIITPAGATGPPSLVIGGATTLFPPSSSQLSSIRYRISPSRFFSGSSASTVVASQSTCDSDLDQGKIIGRALAFSLSGRILNSPLGDPVICNFDSQGTLLPVSYSISFDSAQEAYLRTHPEQAQNLIISVELYSGQEFKSVLPEQFYQNLEVGNRDPINATISETSTLSVALLGLEIAKKLGVPQDQLKLGEENAGLDSNDPEILAVIRRNKIDVKGFSDLSTAAVTSSDSPFRFLADKIREVNSPSNLLNTNRSPSKTDELARILTGTSTDSTDQNFFETIERAKRLSASSSDLLASQKSAREKDVIQAAEILQLQKLAQVLVQGNSFSEALIDVVDVVTQSLSLAESTTGNAGIEDQTLSRFREVVTTVTANLESLKSSSGTSAGLQIIAKAVAFPEDLVKDLVSNQEAARHLASIIGKASTVLNKAREAESLGSRKFLAELDDTVSVLDGSVDLLNTLVINAPDTDTVSEILSGAIESSSSNTAAADVIFSRISVLKTEVESSGEIEVDFSSIIEKSIGTVKDIGNLARNLAKNSANASDALAVLGKVASVLTSKEFEDLLSDEKLDKDFGLRDRLYVSAGRARRIEVDGDSAIIRLDARNSFDPLGQELSYQWYALEDGSETALIGATQALSEVVVNSSGQEEQSYLVRVRSSDGRQAIASVIYKFVRELAPVIVAPRFMMAKTSSSLLISAKDSFDPKTGSSENLGFLWSFEDSSVLIDSPSMHSTRVSFQKAGVFDGEIRVSKNELTYATQAIRIRVRGLQPPVADTGFSLVLNQPRLIQSGGTRLKNFSFSPESGQESSLNYGWEPRSYFSTESGLNHRARNPKFVLSEPGTYALTLTVTEGSLSSRDELKIIIQPGNPPFAYAGVDQVIQLGAVPVIINLNGSSSFSYATGVPQFSWSGPLSFMDSSQTSEIAKISLEPDDFSDRTLLRFKLEVTDDLGTSSDSVVVAVLPATRPPRAVVDQFPKKSSYFPGDRIALDASFSFSEAGPEITYQWTNLSSLSILSDESSLQTSQIRMEIPEISQPIVFRMKLTLTDQNQKSSVQELEFRAKPRILAPIAVLRPALVLLEDSQPAQSLTIDGSGSFSRGGGLLSFAWSLDTHRISILSSTLSSSALEIQAPQDASDGISAVRLTVTDGQGLSSSKTVQVFIKARALLVEPMEMEVFFKRAISPLTRRENPFFDEQSGFYLFEGGGLFQVFGFALDPNENSQEIQLSAALYNYDPSQSDGLGNFSTSLAVLGATSFTSRGQFQISSSLPPTGKYVLKINALGQSDFAVNNSYFLNFEVPDETAQSFSANLLIVSIESLSSGLEILNTSNFEGSFVDSFIKVEVKPNFSDRSSSHPVEYLYSHDWDGGDGPRLYFQEVAQGRAQLVVPVPATQTRLSLSLRVKDLVSNTISSPSTVEITLSRASQLPPVAHPGHYPDFTLGKGLSTVRVRLDGLKSFSLGGNPLDFRWSYLGSASVFATGSNFSERPVVEAELVEGEHLFELRVVDGVTGLSDSKFLSLVINPATASGVDFVVEGELQVPRVVVEGNQVSIRAEFRVIRLALQAANVLASNIRYFLELNGSLLSPTENERGAVFEGNLELDFGEHEVFVSAYYDANEDRQNNPGESSQFKKRILVKVIRELKPLELSLSFAGTSERQSVINVFDGQTMSSELNPVLEIINPNTTGSWTEIRQWTDKLIYQVLDPQTQQPVSFHAYGVTTAVMERSYSSSTSTSSVTYALNLALPLGEYILSVGSHSLAASGEIAQGEVRHRLWVRQVPNLLQNIPIVHGLDLMWNEVADAKLYQVFLRKESDSAAALILETTAFDFEIHDLYTSTHVVRVYAEYDHRPDWLPAGRVNYLDSKAQALPLNTAPQVTADNVVLSEDTSLLIDVLRNDFDTDGDSLLVNIDQVGEPVQTSVTILNASISLENGKIRYTPNPNFNGDDSFMYWVSDGYGAIATGTVDVTVRPVNDPLIATPDTATTLEDTSITIDVLSNDTDLESSSLIVSAFSQASTGTVSAVTGGLLYTPDLNFNGSDSFTYAASDGDGGSATATVSLTITAVNDAPIANLDSVTTLEDSSILIDVLDNDRDVDSTDLVISSYTQPSNGSVSAVSGGLLYSPDLNFHGEDRFTYRISDDGGGNATAVVSLTVIAAPLGNSKPQFLRLASDSLLPIPLSTETDELVTLTLSATEDVPLNFWVHAFDRDAITSPYWNPDLITFVYDAPVVSQIHNPPDDIIIEPYVSGTAYHSARIQWTPRTIDTDENQPAGVGTVKQTQFRVKAVANCPTGPLLVDGCETESSFINVLVDVRSIDEAPKFLGLFKDNIPVLELDGTIHSSRIVELKEGVSVEIKHGARDEENQPITNIKIRGEDTSLSSFKSNFVLLNVQKDNQVGFGSQDAFIVMTGSPTIRDYINVHPSVTGSPICSLPLWVTSVKSDCRPPVVTMTLDIQNSIGATGETTSASKVLSFRVVDVADPLVFVDPSTADPAARFSSATTNVRFNGTVNLAANEDQNFTLNLAAYNARDKDPKLWSAFQFTIVQFPDPVGDMSIDSHSLTTNNTTAVLTWTPRQEHVDGTEDRVHEVIIRGCIRDPEKVDPTIILPSSCKDQTFKINVNASADAPVIFFGDDLRNLITNPITSKAPFVIFEDSVFEKKIRVEDEDLQAVNVQISLFLSNLAGQNNVISHSVGSVLSSTNETLTPGNDDALDGDEDLNFVETQIRWASIDADDIYLQPQSTGYNDTFATYVLRITGNTRGVSDPSGQTVTDIFLEVRSVNDIPSFTTGILPAIRQSEPAGAVTTLDLTNLVINEEGDPLNFTLIDKGTAVDFLEDLSASQLFERTHILHLLGSPGENGVGNHNLTIKVEEQADPDNSTIANLILPVTDSLTSYLSPSPPDFVSAVGRKGEISLEWSSGLNALGYKIYSDASLQLTTNSQVRTVSTTSTTYVSFLSEDLVSFAVASLRNQRESVFSQVVSTRPILAPISSFYPSHNSTGLALNTSFTIIFDEPIFQINGSAITNPSDLLSISDSTGAFASITASVTTSTTLITLNPLDDLKVATDYFLTLSPVENAAGFETGFKEIQFRTCEGYFTLRIAGSCHGYTIGSNINHWHLASEAQYATVLAREFSLVVPEVEAKWSYLEPTEQGRNYTDLDTIHGFAEQNTQETKGHVLLWHSSIPSFVTSAADAGTLTTAQLQTWMDTHIITTLERYRGKIHQWDVVNEAFNDDGTYRDTLFLQKLGAGFIPAAHSLAHSVDPTLRLLYNDYGIATINSKSNAVYSLATQMIASGVPIHGIGMQMHISASNPPNLESVQENIQRFGRLGLEVQISEMDMRISSLPGTIEENLLVQKDLYRKVVGICRVEPNCNTVIFWGFTDKHTWIDGFFGADDPLLFDENYISKPAFDGVTQALKEGLRTDDYASLFSFGGLPLTTSGVPALKVLSNIGFKIGYSESRKNPIWTAYRIFQMDNPTTNSYSSYTIDDRTDARVKTGDYTSTGYGRGLLAPQYAIDTRYGLDARKEARKMSNITPQISYLNSHVMDALEDKVAEDFAQDYEEVWVMTGSIFDSNIETLSSGTGVEVPDSFFKIVSDIENGEPRVLAFLVHQTSNDKTNLAQYLVPVDEIERLTGLDFFWRLEDKLESTLEKNAAIALWDSIPSSPGSTTSTGPSINETGDELGGAVFFAGEPQATTSTATLLILTNTGFTVAYDEARQNPAFAAYRLFALSTVVTHDRPSSFSKDVRTVAQIVHADYTNSGYDRGHVAPNYAIDTRFGQTAQVQSFLMSNITPQLPYVNRTIIRLLEEKIAKDYANDFLQVWVVTGPIFEGSVETLDSGVEIADAFYKVVVDIDQGLPRLLAFIIPHTANSSDLSLYLTTVDEVESRTGLDFFSELEDSLENTLESTSPTALW
jgi:GH35 family endo-1,4-beta-xylanase/DNA/RNA endonuclease G (NUC1)